MNCNILGVTIIVNLRLEEMLWKMILIYEGIDGSLYSNLVMLVYLT